MSYSRRTQLQSATNAIRVLIVLCLFLACGLACTRISHQCCSEKREEDNLDNSRGMHIFTTSAGSNTKLRQLITPNFGRVISGGPLSRIINRKIGLENG